MKRNIDAELVVLARESRALTQSALAKKTGLSQSKISKLEAGLLPVLVKDLATISRALEYPERFFYQAEHPCAFGSSCSYHRKRQGAPVRELKTVYAKVNILRMQIARLLRGVDVEWENKFHRMDIDAFDGDAEGIAALVRNTWGLPRGPVNNLVVAIESAGAIVVPCAFGTRSLDAVSQWVPGQPPMFFVNADQPTDRLRFTLSHELGHLIMHTIPTSDLEREADRFASEFLMPEDDLRPDLGKPLTLQHLAGLKARWKASMAALARRARDLGTITERQYRNLMIRMSKLGWRKREPVSLAPEDPTVLRSIIDVYIRDQKYSMAELAELALCDEDWFRQQYLGQHSPLRLVT